MKNKEEKIMLSVAGVAVFGGLPSLVYVMGKGVMNFSDGGFMGALAVLGSVFMICATVIYLIQRQNGGANDVAQAKAKKEAERILRSDRIIDHK